MNHIKRKRQLYIKLAKLLAEIVFAVFLGVLLTNYIIPNGAGTRIPYMLATAILIVRSVRYIKIINGFVAFIYSVTISYGVASLFVYGLKAVALFLETSNGQMGLTGEGAILAFFAIFSIVFMFTLIYATIVKTAKCQEEIAEENKKNPIKF